MVMLIDIIKANSFGLCLSMVYSLPLPADRVAAVAARAAELLAMDAVWVDRLKPKPRKLNIRQYLRGIEYLV